jgi:hypothetical protein
MGECSGYYLCQGTGCYSALLIPAEVGDIADSQEPKLLDRTSHVGVL